MYVYEGLNLGTYVIQYKEEIIQDKCSRLKGNARYREFLLLQVDIQLGSDVAAGEVTYAYHEERRRCDPLLTASRTHPAAAHSFQTQRRLSAQLPITVDTTADTNEI